jgi:hypothetical protein
VDLGRVVRDALAVYYFPGMWGWERSVVQPLVAQAVERSLSDQQASWSNPDSLSASQAADLATSREVAHAILDAYHHWARDLDDFTPMRVESDFEVNVLDPRTDGAELVTPDGMPVRFADRIEMLAMDQQRHHWIVCHQFGALEVEEVLHLDEHRLLLCWAWECFSLDVEIKGVIYNHLPLDGTMAFGRRQVGLDRREISAAARRLGTSALAMLDVGTDPDPNPSLSHCASCAFLKPCHLLNTGHDATALLESGFRRVEPVLIEGRLGGSTWAMGRGAAPPRFDRRP